MKTMISFLISLFVVLAMAIPAEAQYRRGYDPRVATIYGAIYGGETRQPYYVRDLYPDQGYNVGIWNSWNRRPYEGGYAYEYPHSGPYQGSWGRIIQGAGGDPYFDALVIPCRVLDKGQRWKKGIGTVAMTTVLGALIGEAKGNPGRGAVYGAGGGAGLALLNDSNYCSPPQQVMLPVQPMAQPTVQRIDEPASYAEPVSQVPATTKLVRNRFEEATVRVYDGSTRIAELGPGEELEIVVLSSGKIWGEALLENTKNWRIEWVPLQMGRGINSLPYEAGWVFGHPDTRPEL